MWDSSHQERANAEGWGLVTTFENGDVHPVWDIVVHGTKFKSAQAAGVAVIEAARRGGAIHQHALKLVTQSRMRPAKTKPKGKK